MTTLVKIHRKGQMTLPTSFARLRGIGEGSLVELSLKNGKAVVAPRVLLDRGELANADNEHTLAQRRTIDARLAEGAG